MDMQTLVDDIAAYAGAAAPAGTVADYIPGLSRVDPDRFGIAVAMNSGEVYTAGDADIPFSIQSISKLFTLALALDEDGDRLWTRVHREPSGTPFNSLVQLETEAGIPRNPFINAGALVVTDHLLDTAGDVRMRLLNLLRTESGNSEISVDPAVFASERETGHRNAALTHFLASMGNLRGSVLEVLETYFWQCSLEMSCRDLALAGGFLARGGVGADGGAVLAPRQVKRINAIMLTCGMYDAAGDFAYRVGLPAKSGVGGGILAVIPGRCTIAVWGPRLDRSGNSAAGIAALDEFTSRTGWSIF
ncbi:glutaminase [Mycetocola spongiae]|uniref:glutaminase n=1 Tax=Mycetocola spongiae TaxID=2859226 RepID=UPI001CF4AF53|nr:glutaminase [Mycetocola spongiae]UCR88893.1 glutaminase [Mycetocola spongiae]